MYNIIGSSEVAEGRKSRYGLAKGLKPCSFVEEMKNSGSGSRRSGSIVIVDCSVNVGIVKSSTLNSSGISHVRGYTTIRFVGL